MTKITIPPEVMEAAARKIAAVKMGLSNDGQYLPDELWHQVLPEATAAIHAAIAAWPRAYSVDNRRIILPLPQESADE